MDTSEVGVAKAVRYGMQSNPPSIATLRTGGSLGTITYAEVRPFCTVFVEWSSLSLRIQFDLFMKRFGPVELCYAKCVGSIFNKEMLIERWFHGAAASDAPSLAKPGVCAGQNT